MRYSGLALVLSAVVLSACGGGGDAPDQSKAAPAATPDTAVAAMPITGDTVVVDMIAEGNTFKFMPTDVTVKAGDGIKFVTKSGNPHNVAFNPMELPADVRAQLKANMTDQSAELQSPILPNIGDSYVISFGGVKPGKYNITCPLHIAQGMRGTVTVQ
jgi:plastocyanin